MNIPVGSDVEIGIYSAKKYSFVEAIMVSNDQSFTRNLSSPER